MSLPRAARAAPLRVRRARPADARVQAAIMRAAALAEAGAYPARALLAWASLPPLYHRWAMTAGGELRLVAERGRRALGFAGLRGGEVTALFVRPSAAGRGVGAALLARIEAEARRRGLVRLRVLAARGAVPFYAACGFSPGAPARAPLPGGLALPARWMAKRCGPRPRGPATPRGGRG